MATTDFFPLQVNYEEKCMQLVLFPGALPSVVVPSTDATLTLASIDRPIRPYVCGRLPEMKFKSLTPSLL